MIKINAYAKINLTLKILGQRPDGYHDIESVFHCISLHDQLTLSTRKDGKIILKCNDPVLPTDSSNLAYRAAVTLRELAEKKYPSKRTFGATISLKKNIPVGAGLGGGSSDAATVLVGLKRLWKLDKISPSDLKKTAASLGSDIPFFLKGGTAYVTGRGEKVEPKKCPDKYHFLVVYPGFSVSTAWAYKNFKKIKNGLTKGHKFSKMLLKLCGSGKSALDISRYFVNDLENAVIPSHRMISKVKADLLNAGALNSMMSGSGSSVFGLFPDFESADKAYSKISKIWPRSFLVNSVSSEYRSV
jgi:4-diphosphocytidyl-2-C-methyl-D-erythritol kinase